MSTAISKTEFQATCHGITLCHWGWRGEDGGFERDTEDFVLFQRFARSLKLLGLDHRVAHVFMNTKACIWNIEGNFDDESEMEIINSCASEVFDAYFIGEEYFQSRIDDGEAVLSKLERSDLEETVALMREAIQLRLALGYSTFA